MWITGANRQGIEDVLSLLQRSHKAAHFTAGSKRAFKTSQALKASQTAQDVAGAAPRLRFAPSPTGYLHLGGLRTALFNHLFARKFGGKWILRIEDTDQARLVPDTVLALQETLSWCGLHYDEGPNIGGAYGPYIQSERLYLYRRYAERLLESRKAYRDFRPASQLAERPAAKGKSYAARRLVESYVPPDEEEASRLIRDGKKYVVRLKMQPIDTSYVDLVYGQLSFPADPGVVDPILLKSDGWPTYHLANVVDDHEMGITHVLRGEEWLPSLPKHLSIYAALGLVPPRFAHLPLLVNADGTKLSKRSGDVSVEAYRRQGWEPEALVNFVALVGYNHHAKGKQTEAREASEMSPGQDDREVMSMAQLIDSFDPERISHSRATLDAAKLAFLNRRHLALRPPSAVVPRLRSILSDSSVGEQSGRDDAELAKILKLVSERAHRLVDVLSEASFFFRPTAELPEWSTSQEALDMQSKLQAQVYVEVLGRVLARLESFDGWQRSDVSKLLRQQLDEVGEEAPAVTASASPGPTAGIDAGSLDTLRKTKRAAPVLKILRHALTARRSGPMVADILAVLGKERSLARLQAAKKRMEGVERAATGSAQA